jgi:hypothetical protein
MATAFIAFPFFDYMAATPSLTHLRIIFAILAVGYQIWYYNTKYWKESVQYLKLGKKLRPELMSFSFNLLNLVTMYTTFYISFELFQLTRYWF